MASVMVCREADAACEEIPNGRRCAHCPLKLGGVNCDPLVPDPLDHAKHIRDRIDALDAERERLWQEYLRVLPAGRVDADDLAWARSSAGNAGVGASSETQQKGGA